MSTVIHRTADLCPAIQSAGTPPPYLADAYAAGSGTAHGAKNFSIGQVTSVAADLNWNAEANDLAFRYGGGTVYAVAAGLDITATGLVATIAPGHATIGSIAEVYAAQTKNLSDNSANYLWISQATAIVLITNSTTPPTGSSPCCYLGCIDTASGAVVRIDVAGVVYARNGRFRYTADTTTPADTPSAGAAGSFTVTSGGVYLWDGGNWQLAGVAGSTVYFGALPHTSGDATVHDSWSTTGGVHVTPGDRTLWGGTSTEVVNARTETGTAPFTSTVFTTLLGRLNALGGWISALWARTLTANNGLTGGGDLSANRAFGVDGFAGAATGTGPIKNGSGGFDWDLPGGVQSVDLSMPTGFVSSGGPITAGGTGTLAVTLSISGLLKGSGGAVVAAVAGTDYAAASHTHDGAAIVSGQVGPAFLGTGTANAFKFLRGDGAWAVLTGGVPLASSTDTGTVKTDVDDPGPDPVVYLKTSVDDLFAALPVPCLVASFCYAYTPLGTGADMATLFVLPPDHDGSSITYLPVALQLRKEDPGATDADVTFTLEQYTGTGAFTVSHSQTYTLPMGDYETTIPDTDITAFTFTTGDKLRINFASFGTALMLSAQIILKRS